MVYSPLTTQLRFSEGELRAACQRAYNDWAAEFNAASQGRIILLADIPSHDPKAARDELERVAKLGHRGAIIHQFQGAEPAFEDSWHPFWDAAEETRLPISLHLGPGTHSLKVPAARHWASTAAPTSRSGPICPRGWLLPAAPARCAVAQA